MIGEYNGLECLSEVDLNPLIPEKQSRINKAGKVSRAPYRIQRMGKLSRPSNVRYYKTGKILRAPYKIQRMGKLSRPNTKYFLPLNKKG